MEKFTQIGMLLDIYSGLLTDRQRDVMDLYYNYDLSLAEIAEHFEISRQGVHDLVKRSEQILLNMEENIGIVEQRGRMIESIRAIEKEIDIIIKDLENGVQLGSQNFKDRLKDIKAKVVGLTHI